MKNKASNVPKRLTGLTNLARLAHYDFWAGGDIWGCTRPELREAVALIEGLRPDERMQVLVQNDRLNSVEVHKLLDGLDQAEIYYSAGPVEAATLRELFSNKV
ncbi:hypothetical protein ACYHMY_28490 (plasmid) [Pseudomonas amygdali pv. morsprunorum]